MLNLLEKLHVVCIEELLNFPVTSCVHNVMYSRTKVVITYIPLPLLVVKCTRKNVTYSFHARTHTHIHTHVHDPLT